MTPAQGSGRPSVAPPRSAGRPPTGPVGCGRRSVLVGLAGGPGPRRVRRRAVAGAAVAPGEVRLAGPAPALPPGAHGRRVHSGLGRRSPPSVSSSPADPAALQAFVDAVSTPGSPQYRHYLATGQFAATFGPTAATVAAARAWLASVGLQVGPTSPDGLLIPVSGTAGQMEQGLRRAAGRGPTARRPGGPGQSPPIPQCRPRWPAPSAG